MSKRILPALLIFLALTIGLTYYLGWPKIEREEVRRPLWLPPDTASDLAAEWISGPRQRMPDLEAFKRAGFEQVQVVVSSRDFVSEAPGSFAVNYLGRHPGEAKTHYFSYPVGTYTLDWPGGYQPVEVDGVDLDVGNQELVVNLSGSFRLLGVAFVLSAFLAAILSTVVYSALWRPGPVLATEASYRTGW